jgi:putative ABC transport system ATP-binding protein
MIAGEQLSLAVNGTALWRDLDFSVRPGQILAIAGPSGSGKTSLLNCVGGLIVPTGGRVRVSGREPYRLRRGERRSFFQSTVAILQQDYGLIDEWSIFRNLELAYRMERAGRASHKRTMADALRRFGINHELETSVARLSGGERQRVAIARLFLKKAEVLLADEPSSALDGLNCSLLNEALLERKADGGTIMISTHDPRVLEICDEVMRLE